MAERDPRSVAAAVKVIPPSENVQVVTDICRIGVELPAPMQLAVGKQVREETREQPYFFLLPEAMSELIVSIAAGGESKFALGLARGATGIADARGGGPDASIPDGAAGRATDTRGDHPARIPIPELIPSSGFEAIDLAADLLQETIEAGGRRESPRDYSEYWRPAIKKTLGNHGDDVTQGLVAAVRNAALDLADEDPARLRAVR